MLLVVMVTHLQYNRSTAIEGNMGICGMLGSLIMSRKCFCVIKSPPTRRLDSHRSRVCAAAAREEGGRGTAGGLPGNCCHGYSLAAERHVFAYVSVALVDTCRMALCACKLRIGTCICACMCM